MGAVEPGKAQLALVAALWNHQKQRQNLLRDHPPARVSIDHGPSVFNHIMGAVSYQGISDHAADVWTARNGSITWELVEQGLNGRQRLCPRLCSGFAGFSGCGYVKGGPGAGSGPRCAEPRRLRWCPVPRLPGRKGVLNRTAHALFFFIQEGHWQRLLEQSADDGANTGEKVSQAVAALSQVEGISHKLANMVLADAFISQEEHHWQGLGRHFVAVDVLVHNWLARTGIHRHCGQEHRYASTHCHDRCTAIVRALSAGLRAGNRTFADAFPRPLQHAIWTFCTGDQGICNGRRINDRQRCQQTACPLYRRCARVVLDPRGEP